MATTQPNPVNPAAGPAVPPQPPPPPPAPAAAPPRIDLDGMAVDPKPFKAMPRQVFQPVIDISPVFGDKEKNKEQIKQIGLDLRLILKRWGFFHVTGHKVDMDLCRTALARMKLFFDQDYGFKKQYHRSKSLALRGYESLLDPAWMNSHRTELSESFTWGTEWFEQPMGGGFLQGPNQWPEWGSLQNSVQFGVILLIWQAEMRALSWELMKLIADSLLICPENYWEDVWATDAIMFSSGHKYNTAAGLPEADEYECIDESGKKAIRNYDFPQKPKPFISSGWLSLMVSENDFLGPLLDPAARFMVRTPSGELREHDHWSDPEWKAWKKSFAKKNDYIFCTPEVLSDGRYVVPNLWTGRSARDAEYTLTFTLEPRLNSVIECEWPVPPGLEEDKKYYQAWHADHFLRTMYRDQYNLAKQRVAQDRIDVGREAKRRGKRPSQGESPTRDTKRYKATISRPLDPWQPKYVFRDEEGDVRMEDVEQKKKRDYLRNFGIRKSTRSNEPTMTEGNRGRQQGAATPPGQRSTPTQGRPDYSEAGELAEVQRYLREGTPQSPEQQSTAPTSSPGVEMPLTPSQRRERPLASMPSPPTAASSGTALSRIEESSENNRPAGPPLTTASDHPMPPAPRSHRTMPSHSRPLPGSSRSHPYQPVRPSPLRSSSSRTKDNNATPRVDARGQLLERHPNYVPSDGTAELEENAEAGESSRRQSRFTEEDMVPNTDPEQQRAEADQKSQQSIKKRLKKAYKKHPGCKQQ